MTMGIQQTRDFTNSMRPQGGPDTRFIEFKKRAIPNRAKSKEEGRPIYDSKVFITIQHPGDMLNVLERLATDADAREFPAQWRAYQDGQQSMPEGTPLSVLFPDALEVVENLKHFKLFTVEQLAAVTDGNLQAIGMGGVKMKQDAQAYLKAAGDGKDFHKLRDDVNKMSLQLKTVMDRNAALEGELRRRDELAARGAATPVQPGQAAQRRT